jgi:phage repressor protein C with HTH and peptisase S24 domain
MITLKDKLIAALAEKPFGSQTDLANECGLSKSAVSFWFSGTTKRLRGKNLYSAARYLGVDPVWLSSGTDIKPVRVLQKEAEVGQYVRIAFLDPQAAEGGKAAALPDEAAPPSLAFRRGMLREKNLNPDGLRLYEVRGNAMAPAVENGDLVMVDTSAKAPANNEVWVIRGGETPGLRVRRILINERAEWVLRADNVDKSLYEDERVRSLSITEIEIFGRVVWRGGWRL